MVAVAIAAAAAPGSARGDEALLRGPYPFARDNLLAGRVLIAKGSGQTPGGTKLAVDYGYKLTDGAVPAWLALAINFQHAGCQSSSSTGDCGQGGTTVFETLGGVRWSLATPIPLVPYVAALAGLVFAFPDGADAAAGVTGRVAAGATYFFYDWFGIGAQVGISLGHLAYDATLPGSRTYSVFDVGGGVDLAF